MYGRDVSSVPFIIAATFFSPCIHLLSNLNQLLIYCAFFIICHLRHVTWVESGSTWLFEMVFSIPNNFLEFHPGCYIYFFSFLLLSSILGKDVSQCNYSSIERYLGCFHIGVIMNNTVKNIPGQSLVWRHKFSFLWGNGSRVQILSHKVSTCLVSWEYATLLSRVVVPFDIPISSRWDICFS